MSIEDIIQEAKSESMRLRYQTGAIAVRIQVAEDLEKDVPRALTKRVKEMLENGYLKAKLEGALGDATKAGLPPDETLLAATSTLLLWFARESGQAIADILKTTRYDQGVSAGKSVALQDIATKLVELQAGVQVPPESGDYVPSLNDNGHAHEGPHIAG